MREKRLSKGFGSFRGERNCFRAKLCELKFASLLPIGKTLMIGISTQYFEF